MKIKLILLVIISLYIPTGFCANNNTIILNKVNKTRYFGNIAISSVATYNTDKKFAGYQLVVRPVIHNKDHFIPFRHTSNKSVSELGDSIWVISGNQLPATENTCVEADADQCFPEPNNPFNICYNSCVKNGPEFLYFDKNKNNLYIISSTNDVGNAGGRMLVFVANITSKTIKYLMPIDGFVAATTSPSSKYLVFFGRSIITIHNLETTEDIKIQKENIWTAGKEKLHSMSIISWLNDTQFVYRDNVYHSKFQEGWDQATEYIYDITVRKNIKIRVLEKSEYPMDTDDKNSANVPLL